MSTIISAERGAETLIGFLLDKTSQARVYQHEFGDEPNDQRKSGEGREGALWPEPTAHVAIFGSGLSGTGGYQRERRG